LTGLAIVLLAGCGSSASSGTGTSGISTLSTVGSTTGAPALHTVHTITSATAERDKLLALAKPGTAVSSQGTVPGWPPANGSGIPSTPSDVSGFGFVPDKAKNIQYLSFAVMDTGNRCAGGDLEANFAGTQIITARPITVPAQGPCTGDEVAKIAGHG
jgi:hypothetical protein